MERKLKDSGHPWIGVIPEHWELHYLRGISNGFRKGNGITKEDLTPNGDIACVRYGELYTRYNHFITEIYCKTNKNSIQNPVEAEYGDIYFTCSGEDIECIGKSVAFLSNTPCLIGGDLIIMKHSQNPKFMGYSLDSYVCQKQKSCGKSKLKVVHISVKDLKNLAIPVPPLAEQERIAAYLDEKCGEIDELIGIEEQMISDLEAYRQAVITEAVTKGLNRNTPFKPSAVEWIGDMPKHWGLLAVKRVFHNLDYLRKPIASENRQRNNPIYDYYGASGVIDKIDYYNVDDTVLLIGEDGANLVMRNLPLIYKASGKIWVNNHAHILKPKKGYDYDFLSYLLEAGDYSLYITGMAQPKLSQENLNMFLICIPPLSEQQEIAEYLDAKCAEIDDLIKIKQEKIETLKEYRQSLIFEAVTGKIEIA